ncbi:MAG: hypothetical protein NTW80_11940 [Deltaproteobacteria bacterium]|nr:hypothetical protein [Deltaproteobacteria bacterium]
MQKIRRGYLIWLILAGLLVLTFGTTPAGAEKGLLDRSWGDYAFGTYGGNREASRQGREDIVARENYCSTSGCILRLEGVEVRPNKARAGQAMVLATTYTIMTPDAVAIPVAITRDIFFQGKSLGRTKSMEMRKLNGTWLQEVDFTLPANARPGIYTLKTKVTTGYAMSEKETQFQVE